jgi:tetratricopeptide (TPR) repeat protein
MAIGVSFSQRFLKPVGLLALALVLLSPRAEADDQIKKKDGTIITGQILGASDGQVMMSTHSSTGSVVRLPYYLSDIDSITMTVPDAVTQVKGAGPTVTIAALEPVVKQFAGLPVDWVVEAMASLAEAYNAQGQSAKAVAIYNQIGTLYPGSKYVDFAVASKSKLSLEQGKAEEALTTVQPIIDNANKDLTPSPAEGGVYATAFLVYGQALEAQNKPEQALEAYLTVKTMFYQNTDLANQADQLAKKLRAANPDLGVD